MKQKRDVKYVPIFLWVNEQNDICWRQVDYDKWRRVKPDKARSLDVMAAQSAIIFKVKTPVSWKTTDIEYIIQTQVQQAFTEYWTRD